MIWKQILIHNQESCVINGGTRTNYFKLEEDTRQSDPFLVYHAKLKIHFYTQRMQTILHYFLKGEKSAIDIFDIFWT